jgi:N-acyl-D-amino-acid deacylase
MVCEIVHDLPGGEWLRVQRPKGYRSIIGNGAETFSEGNCTRAAPGKLLRNGHARFTSDTLI